MSVNDSIMRIAPHMKMAEALISQGKFDEAEDHLEQFIGGCEACYRDNPNNDGRRAAMLGYTTGAHLYGQMFKTNSDSYSFRRHKRGRELADEAIKITFEILNEKDDPGNAIQFVGAVTKGLSHGLSEVVRKYQEEADHWMKMLLKYFPNNEQVLTVSKNYNEAKNISERNELLFQNMSR